ncbi:Qat anti-phage system TatD family nuclease QatD [Hoeflea alexandrii]|nr:Qat anti-phage system TatD family nuclease QatD [Hoeflea alexandrii]MCY0151056.1 TatD family hydrolase [Hoeflea alexandrii]
MMVSAPRYVDFHCHLDLYPDLENAISRCEMSRTATLAVTTTPKAFRRNMQLAKGKEFVRVALGLHPHLVEDRWNEMPLFDALLNETRYVGEIGLDAGPQFYKSLDKQTEVFTHILKLSNDHGNKILSIHSVRTASKVLDLLERHFSGGSGRAVLHWFGGTLPEAERAVELGCYFSVNRAMFRNERGRKLIRSLPMDRILTETDGPFVEDQNKPVLAGDVAYTVSLLSELFATEISNMQSKITRNFASVVSHEAS